MDHPPPDTVKGSLLPVKHLRPRSRFLIGENVLECLILTKLIARLLWLKGQIAAMCSWYY